MDETLTLAAILERFLTYQRASNHSPKQIAHYQRTFLDFDRFLAATNRSPLATVLTTSTCEAFTIWLRETPIKPYRGSTQRTESGIAGHLKDLKAFAHWAVDPDQGFITWPLKIRLPKVPQVLFPLFEPADLVRIFESRHLKGGDYQLRNRALVALLLDTGIRLAEAAALTPRAIVGKQYVQVTGKGHKERVAPFSAALVHLEAWLDARDPLGFTDGDPLFGLTYHGIKVFMVRLARDTGLRVHCHKFRHQATTMLVRKTGGLHAAKRILGHANLATVEIYLSFDTADLVAKHAQGSPMTELAALLPQPPAKRRRLSS